MTAQTRAAVWLDHREARIFHVDLEGFDERKLQAPLHHIHRHPKGAERKQAQAEDEGRFFADIARGLEAASEILVLGPSTAKSQLLEYLERHARTIASRVTAVETTDHPTDAQLVAHIRRHFRIPEPRVS